MDFLGEREIDDVDNEVIFCTSGASDAFQNKKLKEIRY